MAATGKNNPRGGRGGVSPQSMARWAERKRRPGINFQSLNADYLKLAISTIVDAGGAIQFGELQGGVGVMVKVFVGDARSQLPAILNVELEELLLDVVEDWSSSSEDPFMAWGIGNPRQLAAD